MKENDRYKEELEQSSYQMKFVPMERGQTIERENLKITALVSHHGKPGTVFNYIIERGGKTLLYALDCGGYDEDMLEILKGKKFDCVVLEGTFGHMKEEFTFHQNKEKNLRMLDFFTGNHLWKNEPNMVLSHMTPHWTPPYDLYAPEMLKYGIIVAYDGMQIEI